MRSILNGTYQEYYGSVGCTPGRSFHPSVNPIADFYDERLEHAMRTALDAPIDALDEQEQSFVAKIRDHGWYRTGVFEGEEYPGFSYTTGFWLGATQPEVIMFSLKGEIAHDVFWDLYRDAKAGSSVPIAAPTDQVFGNQPAYAFHVAKRFYRDHLGWSRWFYRGDDFACLQIVWPDRDGRFPWDEGFDQAFANSQPDLTEHGWLAALGR